MAIINEKIADVAINVDYLTMINPILDANNMTIEEFVSASIKRAVLDKKIPFNDKFTYAEEKTLINQNIQYQNLPVMNLNTPELLSQWLYEDDEY